MAARNQLPFSAAVPMIEVGFSLSLQGKGEKASLTPSLSRGERE